MEVAGVNLPFIVVVVIGILLIGLVWRLVKGAIKLVLMLAIIAVVAYVVLNVLR
ncbi:MAG TPA: hypothetical protein VF897_23430 [Roseiflexaceae bacterium]